MFAGTVYFAPSEQLTRPQPFLEVRKGCAITVAAACVSLGALSAGLLERLGAVQAFRLLRDGVWIRIPIENGANLDELAEKAAKFGFEVRRICVDADATNP